MIISCTCGARLKISDEKLTDSGVKVKCPKCGTVHIAAKPRKDASDLSAGASASKLTPSEPGSVTSQSAHAAAAPASPTGGPLVLVAHDSKVVADMIADVLRKAGMSSKHAANGLEALKMATTVKPQAMVVDVGLTGIYGFDLCERLKGDPDTKDIKIVLLSSVYGLTAYKRSPVRLYGADDYIEKHHIPDELAPKILRMISGAGNGAGAGSSREGVMSAPMQAREEVLSESRPPLPGEGKSSPDAASREFEMPEVPSVMPTTPVTLTTTRKPSASVTSSRTITPPSVAAEREEEARPVAPPRARQAASGPAPGPLKGSGVSDQPAAVRTAPADASVRLDAAFFENDEYAAPEKAAPQEAIDPAQIEKAKRFARIIVSDVVLYNQEAVAVGLERGTFYDLLKDDITEGRTVYAERVPESIRRNRDYLQEAFDEFIASKKKRR